MCVDALCLSPAEAAELEEAVKRRDRPAVATAAARALAQAAEITTAVAAMLRQAGWSQGETDLFLVGVRDE